MVRRGRLAPRAAPAAGRPKPRGRSRRTAALAISVALHLGLLIAVFGVAAGTPAAEGAYEDGPPAIDVSLVSLPSTPPPPASGAAGGRLTPLVAKTATEAPPVFQSPVQPASQLDTLANRLRAQTPVQAPQQPPQPSRPPSPPAPPAPPVQVQVAQADRPAAPGVKGPSHAGSRGNGGERGALWGAMEPCFRRIGLHPVVPVTLEVTIDATGQLSKPPEILRDFGVSDEQRLRAESNALTALSVCLPRGDLRFGGAVYRLEFTPD